MNDVDDFADDGDGEKNISHGPRYPESGDKSVTAKTIFRSAAFSLDELRERQNVTSIFSQK